MTLNDIATLVCTKLNQNETEDVAACKLFAQRRYEMIWDDQLWKDSLIEWTYTIPDSSLAYDPISPWMPTKQRLILPVQFNKVIAARTDIRRLNVQSAEVFYRSDYDSFQNGATLLDYLVLPPCVWELDTSAGITVHYSSDDAGKTVIVDLLASDGSTVDRDSTSLPAVSGGHSGDYQFDTGQRIDSFSKPVTQQPMTLGAGPSFLNSTGATQTLTFYDSGSNVVRTVTFADGAEALYPSTAVTFTIAAQNNSLQNPIPTLTYSAGQVVLSKLGFLFSTLGTQNRAITIATLNGPDVAAQKRQRIQLIGSVASPFPTIRVLGKSKPNTFTADNDSTAISGVDNCLIAAAQYDMLQRERQFNKAQLALQEFQQLLGQLKQQEVVQTAHNKRIMPEEGYGDLYDMHSNLPLSF